VLASDCLEKQKKILRQLEEKRSSSEAEQASRVDKSTGAILILPSPDDPHTDKTLSPSMIIIGKLRTGKFFQQRSSKSYVRMQMLLSVNP